MDGAATLYKDAAQEAAWIGGGAHGEYRHTPACSGPLLAPPSARKLLCAPAGSKSGSVPHRDDAFADDRWQSSAETRPCGWWSAGWNSCRPARPHVRPQSAVSTDRSWDGTRARPD